MVQEYMQEAKQRCNFTWTPKPNLWTPIETRKMPWDEQEGIGQTTLVLSSHINAKDLFSVKLPSLDLSTSIFQKHSVF